MTQQPDTIVKYDIVFEAVYAPGGDPNGTDDDYPADPNVPSRYNYPGLKAFLRKLNDAPSEITNRVAGVKSFQLVPANTLIFRGTLTLEVPSSPGAESQVPLLSGELIEVDDPSDPRGVFYYDYRAEWAIGTILEAILWTPLSGPSIRGEFSPMIVSVTKRWTPEGSGEMSQLYVTGRVGTDGPRGSGGARGD
jgi:hypothetical protein